MSFRNFLYLSFAIYLFIFSGCTSGTCEEATDSVVNMTLQFSEDSGITIVDSITIYGLDMPFLLYDTVSTKLVKLPLDASSTMVRFAIRRGSLTDTLGIEYTSSVRFISKPCGYTFYYNIENISFTNNRIDNIIIINREINPGDEENLRTFY